MKEVYKGWQLSTPHTWQLSTPHTGSLKTAFMNVCISRCSVDMKEVHKGCQLSPLTKFALFLGKTKNLFIKNDLLIKNQHF